MAVMVDTFYVMNNFCETGLFLMFVCRFFWESIQGHHKQCLNLTTATDFSMPYQ